jgi:hypothetical protein
MSDTKLLFSILIFLSVFIFVQGLFQTELIQIAETSDTNYSENSSVMNPEVTSLPSPPVCKRPQTAYQNPAQWVLDSIINSPLVCIGDYGLWMLNMMYFISTISWINATIMFAIIGTLGFIILRWIRGTG